MRLLIDTNALLWLLDGDDRLGPIARSAVQSAEVLAISVGSLWAIAIKISIGKLAPIPGLHDAITRLGFERLAITDDHLSALQALPLHHRDPFDRILICQALTDGFRVLTADDIFATYGPLVVDARC